MTKKIIISLIILLMPIDVLADTLIWTDEEKSDLTLVNKEVRYRYYLPVKKGEYVLRGVASPNYLYEDEKDITYTPFSNNLSACPDNSSSQFDIEKVKKYTYIAVPKVRYLIINPTRSIEAFTFQVLNPNKEIITAGSTNEVGKTIDLNTEYSLKLLTLVLSDEAKVSFLTSDYTNVLEIPLAKDSLSIEDYLKHNPSSFTAEETTQNIHSDDTIIVKEEELCRTRKAYTYRYNIEKTYYSSNYYHTLSLDGYLPDKENSKTYYQYLIPSSDDNSHLLSKEKNEEKPIVTTDNHSSEENSDDKYLGEKNTAPSKIDKPSPIITTDVPQSSIIKSQNNTKIKVITIVLIISLSIISCLSILLYFLHKKKNVD